MKKQLLSVFATLAAGVVMAQIPSPSWTISQNASFSVTSAGHRFLDAVDANVVWLSGYDGVNAGRNYNWFSRTINGGTSYNSGNVFPDTNNYQLGNMEGIDANTAWVSAFQRSAPYSPTNQGGGVIYRTLNGGTNWTNMTAAGMFTNVAASFCNWVSFLSPTDGIVNGDPVNGEYEIWRTTNGGTNWTVVPGANIPDPVSGEFCIVDLYAKSGPNHLWFGTQKGRVYRTNDAGVTWNVSSLSSAPNSTVTELAFSSPLVGIVYAQSPAGFEVHRTIDGGATWTLINPTPIGNVGRNDICHIPGTTYFASVDNQNQMLSYSKDNGNTWTDWGSTGIGYVCVDFANSYKGWTGSFSSATLATSGGIWKYNGIDFLSSFSVPQFLCKGVGNVTTTPVNSSAGNSSPLSFTWSAAPAGVVFSSASASVPVITFSANGTYTISLAVSNPDGVNISTQLVTVLTCSVPVAGFNLSATGCNNVALTLTNTSVGAPNPTVVITASPSTSVTITPGSGSLFSTKFGTPGTYTVTMVATNAAGSNTYTQTINIANCSPSVAFTFPATVCKDTETITTVNTTSGATSYTWNITPTGGVALFQTVGTNKKLAFSIANTYTLTLRATNASGTNSAVQVITVSDCSGVGLFENTNLGNAIKVYPNPARETVNINLPSSFESVKVKLTNILGAVVYDEKLNNNKEKMTISLANNPKGVYFLTVESNNEKVTRKLVIE
jgi:hypothetical protein